MLIEIRRAGFINKGAELMLRAIVKKLACRYPEAQLVIAPSHQSGSQPYGKWAPMGFRPKAWLWRYGVQLGDAAEFLPKKLREMYGIVLDKDIDVVLDAAGFLYSDQWGEAGSHELAKASRRWRRRGTKLIMLPQAFGPFTSESTRRSVREWGKNASLIFARDRDSYGHLIDLLGQQRKILQFPDFTNLIEGALPPGYRSDDKRVAIVPNFRMIDKTGTEGAGYLPFLIRCTQYLVDQDARPFILIHEGDEDAALASQISSAVGGVPIIRELDPVYIKGILGSCDATIGSRFHGLVSALSQGVPSLATGWSHKYRRLFEEYDFAEGLVDVADAPPLIKEKIDLCLRSPTGPAIKEKLLRRSEDWRAASEKMWEIVFEEIGDKKHTLNSQG